MDQRSWTLFLLLVLLMPTNLDLHLAANADSSASGQPESVITETTIVNTHSHQRSQSSGPVSTDDGLVGLRELPGYSGEKGGYGSDDTGINTDAYYFDESRQTINTKIYNKTAVNSTITSGFTHKTNTTFEVSSVLFDISNKTTEDDYQAFNYEPLDNPVAMEFRMENSSRIYDAWAHLYMTVSDTGNMNVSIYNATNDSGKAKPDTLLHSQNVSITGTTTLQAGFEWRIPFLTGVYLDASNTYETSSNLYSFFLVLEYPNNRYRWHYDDGTDGVDEGEAWHGPTWTHNSGRDYYLKTNTSLWLTPLEAQIAINGTRVNSAYKYTDTTVYPAKRAYNFTTPFSTANITATMHTTSSKTSQVTCSYLVHPSHSNVTWTISKDVSSTFITGANENATFVTVPSNWTVGQIKIDGSVAVENTDYEVGSAIGLVRNITLHETSANFTMKMGSKNLMTASMDTYQMPVATWISGNETTAGITDINSGGGQAGPQTNITCVVGQSTGTSNVSLFDPDGTILGDMSFGTYTDTTTNTQTVSMGASERASVQTRIDPNVTLGIWTWRIQWSNGTQAGVKEKNITVFGTAETQLVIPTGNIARLINDPSIQIEVAVLDRTHDKDVGTTFQASWDFDSNSMLSSTDNGTHFIHETSFAIDNDTVTAGDFTVTISIDQQWFDIDDLTFDVALYDRGYVSLTTPATPYYWGEAYIFDFALVNRTDLVDVSVDNTSAISHVIDLDLDYTLTYDNPGDFFRLTVDMGSGRAGHGYTLDVSAAFQRLREDTATQWMDNSTIINIVARSTSLSDDPPAQIHAFTQSMIDYTFRDETGAVDLVQYDFTADSVNVTLGVQAEYSWSNISGVHRLTLQVVDPTVTAVEIHVTCQRFGFTNRSLTTIVPVVPVPVTGTTDDPNQNVTMHHDAATYVDWENTLNSSALQHLEASDFTLEYNSTMFDVSTEYHVNGTLIIVIEANHESAATFSLNVTITGGGYQSNQIELHLTIIDVLTHLNPATADNTYSQTASTGDTPVTFAFTLYDNVTGTMISGPTATLELTNTSETVTITVQGGIVQVQIPLAPDLGDITFSITVLLEYVGYESQTVTLLVFVDPLSDTDVEVDAPESAYFHHGTQIELNFTASGVPIEDYTWDIQTNVSDSFVTIVVDTDQQPTLSFELVVSDLNGTWIMITVEFRKAGNQQQVVEIYLEILLTPTEIQGLGSDTESLPVEDDHATFQFNVVDTVDDTLLQMTHQDMTFDGSMTPTISYSQGFIVMIYVSEDDAGQTLTLTFTLVRSGYESQTVTLYVIVAELERYSLEIDVQSDYEWGSTLVLNIDLVLNESAGLSHLRLMPRSISDFSGIEANATVTFTFANGTQCTLSEVGFFDAAGHISFIFTIPDDCTGADMIVRADGLGMLPVTGEMPTMVITEPGIGNGGDDGIVDLLSDPVFLIIMLSVIVVAAAAIILFAMRARKASQELDDAFGLARFDSNRITVSRLLEQIEDLRNLLVVNSESGLPVFNYSFKETATDEILISGFLQAIATFGRQIAGSDEIIREVSYQEFSINSFSAGTYNFYLISDRKLGNEMKEGLEQLGSWFGEEFDIASTVGGSGIFQANRSSIVQAVRVHLYAWIILPLTLSEFIEPRVRTDAQDLVLDYLASYPRVFLSEIVEALGQIHDTASIVMATAGLVQERCIAVGGYSDRPPSTSPALPEE